MKDFTRTCLGQAVFIAEIYVRYIMDVSTGTKNLFHDLKDYKKVMDTKKDTLIDSNSPNALSLKNSEYFKTLIKRTEKIVTALYMVTELFRDEEPLKDQVRTTSLRLLSGIARLSGVGAIEKYVLLDTAQSNLAEIVSYTEVARTIGMISEMNGTILINEMLKLDEQLSVLQRENRGESFKSGFFGGRVQNQIVLSEKLFESETLDMVGREKSVNSQDFSKGQISKGHTDNNVRYEPYSTLAKQNIVSDKTNEAQKSGKKDIGLKINRRSNILRIVKDRREVNIKDISQLITDCSEKTIQRELNGLVGEGILRRIGDKRWSRYALK